MSTNQTANVIDTAPAAAAADTSAVDAAFNAAWNKAEDTVDMIDDPKTSSELLAGIMLRSIGKASKVKGADYSLSLELAVKNAADLVSKAADLAAAAIDAVQTVTSRPAEKRIVGDTLIRPATIASAVYNVNPTKSELDRGNIAAVLTARNARIKSAAAAAK